MFASCDHCFAEYELDEAKIPAGGARLRCTSCKESFVVVPPEPSDEQRADALAREAIASRASAEPDPPPASEEGEFGLERESEPESELDLDGEPESASESGLDLSGDSESASELGLDLSGDSESAFGSELDLGGDSESASESQRDLDGESEPEPEQAAAEGEFDPDAEGVEWEFNDEPAIREPDPDPDESDFDLGGLSDPEGAVDDLLGSTDPMAADAEAAVDDLLGEIDTGAAELGDPATDLGGDLDASSESLDLGGGAEVEGLAEKIAADAGDSFDDLSDWDVFDHSADAGAPAAPARANRRPSSGECAAPKVGIAIAVADDAMTSVRWTDRIAEIAGWGVFALLMAVALAGGVTPNSSDARATNGTWSGAGFEADQIAGRWVDNAVTGTLYVVSGRVRRADAGSRAVQTRLAIRLIDGRGEEIDGISAPVAPAVPERILRESSPAALEVFQQRGAARIAAAGNGWIAFEAVLTDLPRIAERFELVALER